MRISVKDLVAFEIDARNRYNEMDASARLLGERKPLDERQRRLLAFVQAAAVVYAQAGYIKPADIDQVQIEIDYADSDPDTEP